MKKIRLMLVTLACLLGTVLGQKASAYTVYFVNGGLEWTQFRVFLRDSDDKHNNAGWPGAELTETGDEYDGKAVYKYTFTPDGWTPAVLVFNNNNGGSQTKDITPNDGALYVVTGTGDNAWTEVPGYNGGETPNPPTPPVTDEMTFYFVNEWWENPSQLRIFIRDSADAHNNAAWPGADLTETGDKYEGKTVYKYTFTPDGWTPAVLVFNNGSGGNTNQTADLTPESGKLYIVKGNAVSDTEVIADPKFDGEDPVTPTPTYPEKLYLIGPGFGGWGTFSDTYGATPADGVYTWTFTNGFTTDDFKISGYNYTPAYTNERSDMQAGSTYDCPESDSKTNMKADITEKNVTVKFDMTGATPTLTFITDGGDDPTPPVPGNVNPDGPRTLYISFGQQRILTGDRGKTPQIHFGDYDIDPSADKSMTKVYSESDSPIWKYELSEEEYALGDAVVYFDLVEGSHDTYRIGNAADRDEYNWTKYIYYVDPVKDADREAGHYDGKNKVARQSYITETQFKALKYGEKTKLYITGQGFKNDKGQQISGWSIRPGTGGMMTLDGQNGVFTAVISKAGEAATATPGSDVPGSSAGTEQTGAKFKMGWIYPYDWHQANCADLTIDDNRCWATFNLGIVGIAEDHPAITGGKVEMIRGQGSELNTEVFCTPGRTIPVSRYNQSDWFIRDHYIANSTIGGEAVKYTLVVDLEPDCNTVTLLYFNPEPELTAGKAQIDHAILTDEQAAAIHDAEGAHSLNAEKANPAAHIRYVNVATAEGVLRFEDFDKTKGTSPAGIEYNYGVEFEILLGATQAGTFKPGDEFNGNATFGLPGIAVGQDVELGARAKFTAPSGLHFHTQAITTPVSAVNMENLPALGSVNVTKKSYSYGTNNTGDPKQGIPAGESWYTLGAYAEISCEAPETESGDYVDLYWYGDFDLSCPGYYHNDRPELANGGEIVGPGHHATTLKGDVKGMPLDGYDPSSDEADSRNWAYRLSSARTWPVHLPEVVKVTRKYAEDADGYWDFTEEGLPAGLEVTGNVYAVYPFLIQPEAALTVSTSASHAKRRAPGAAITLDPSKKYALSYQAVATPVSFSLTSGELTGVKDITATTVDDNREVEYYNLQGVRMHGDPAPGIYIRRRGASVEKVIIR